MDNLFQFDKLKNFDEFFNLIIENDEVIIEEFSIFLIKQFCCQRVNIDNNNDLMRNHNQCFYDYIENMYKRILQSLGNLGYNENENCKEKFNRILHELELYGTMKILPIQSIMEDLENIKFIDVKRYFIFFKVNNSKQIEIIHLFVDRLIQNGKFNDAIKYIRQFNVFDREKLLQLIKLLIDNKLVFLVKKIAHLNTTIQIEAINLLISSYNIKEAVDCYILFGINDENLYQLLIKKSKKNLFYHFFSKFFNGKIDLFQIVEFLSSDVDFTNLLIKKFIMKNLISEALYVMDSNDFKNITVTEYNMKIAYDYIAEHNNYKFINSPIVSLQNIETIYKMQKKVKIFPYDDIFSPLTEDCIQLDFDHNKIRFIERIEHLDHLEELSNAEVIGVDSEWYPTSSKFDKNLASILQMASSSSILIIDLLNLKNEEMFIEKLQRVIENKKILGFQFDSDLSMFPQNIREIFVNKTQIINIEKVIKNKFPDLKLPSLSSTVKHLFNKNICKRLQLSNWQKRPLTLRKLHYLALDAFILLNIYNLLG